GEQRALRLWIRRGPMVVGRVTDEAGAVVPRARVHLEYGTSRGRTVETDGAGEYRIADAEVAREPLVVARSPSGALGAFAELARMAHEDDLVVRVDLA